MSDYRQQQEQDEELNDALCRIFQAAWKSGGVSHDTLSKGARGIGQRLANFNIPETTVRPWKQPEAA